MTSNRKAVAGLIPAFLASAVLGPASSARADDPGADDYHTMTHKVWDSYVSAVDVSQVGQWVEGMARPDFRPAELFTDILKLQQEHPGLSEEALKNRILEKHPVLGTPGGVDSLQQWLQSLNRLAGLGPSGPMPNVPNGFQTPMGGSYFPRSDVPFGDRPMGTHRPDNPFVNGSIPGQPAGPDPAFEEDGTIDPSSMYDFEDYSDEYAPHDVARRRRQFFAIKEFWERNIGPMNETPALQELMMQMFVGRHSLDVGDDLSSLSMLGDAGEDFLGVKASSSGSAFDRLKLAGYSLSDIGFDQIAREAFGADAVPTSPPALGDDGIDWKTVLVAVAAVVAVGYFGRRYAGRFDGTGSGRNPARLARAGEWPIDPRSVSGREDVVRAFEFLAVSLCGSAALSWHHERISGELSGRLPGPETADGVGSLVGLYEVAKYTPANEPFTPEMSGRARDLFCRFAGVRSS